MRKNRRKIKRRKRDKSKFKKRKWVKRHLDRPISNRFTRFTTYIIILLELLWILIEVSWFVIDVFLRSN